MILHTLRKIVRDKIVNGSKKRSSEWPKVRKAYLKEHPACEVCGSTKKVEVHHKQPFHLHPELELDPKNFVSLCEGKDFGINDHPSIGHKGNFKLENTDVIEDINKAKTIIKDNDNASTSTGKDALNVFSVILKAEGKKLFA